MRPISPAPQVRADIKTGQATGVAARGDLLFVAAGMLGVQVYELPGLSNPRP